MNDNNLTYTSLADFAAWELEAYADGVEIPHLAQFLAEHPSEAAAWQREQQTLARIPAALYRFDCPAPETLQAYHWQQLAEAEQARMQAHLPLCPHCRAELNELRAFVTASLPNQARRPATPEPSNGWRERVQDTLDQLRLVVANLLAPPSPQFAGVALRDDTELPAAAATPQSLFFEAEETAISLLIQKEISGTLLLSGQLLAVNPELPGQVKLIAQAPEAASLTAQADATGNFAFAQLRPGSYQLQVMVDGKLIIIPVFNL